MGAAAYGRVHIASRNFTLIGAATIVGAFWGGLYVLGFPLGAMHALTAQMKWEVKGSLGSLSGSSLG